MPRSYIDEISIQNFKFFPKLENSIKVDGKHLLLYGENGSGKSSIYWAIYTLLECANKEDDDQIKKYFDPDHDERLTNIHLSRASGNWVDPFIQVTLKDGSAPYFVSFDNTAINGNIEAQESNFSSDFVSYRNLLSLYNFAHSEDIDLFPFFTYAVLPYVKFTPVTYWHQRKDKSIVQLTTDSANKIWDFVLKGPQKDAPKANGSLRYPKGSEQGVIDYRNIVNAFKTGLQDLVTYINTQGNPILKDELGYKLTFKLELEVEALYRGRRKRRDPFLLTEQQFEFPTFKIWFKITEYEGVPNAVKRAQSFLNEARLTAVGLAIRLAVLKRSLSEDAKLKILILDDLLISLDMSNRETVINLILKKYINEYQVFILTHDRVMFDDTLRHVESFHFAEARGAGIIDKAALDKVVSDKWCIFEMYQAIDKNNIPKPYLTDAVSKIQKAFYYFREQVDYNACGNNLRAALEEFFIEFLPVSFRNVQTMLNGLVVQARLYFNYVGYSVDPLDKIDRYLKRSLNPTSHYNPKTNYYRRELKDIFDIFFALKQFKKKALVAVNGLVRFGISTTAGNNYLYTVKLMDDVMVYNKNDGLANFLLPTDKREYVIVGCTKNDSATRRFDNLTNSFTLQELYDDTFEGIRNHLHEVPVVEVNMSQVFRDLNNTTFEVLIQNVI